MLHWSLETFINKLPPLKAVSAFMHHQWRTQAQLLRHLSQILFWFQRLKSRVKRLYFQIYVTILNWQKLDIYITAKDALMDAIFSYPARELVPYLDNPEYRCKKQMILQRLPF